MTENLDSDRSPPGRNSDEEHEDEDLDDDVAVLESSAAATSSKPKPKLGAEEVTKLLKDPGSGFRAKPNTGPKASKSAVWDMVDLVMDGKGQSVGFVQCRKCKRLFSYTSQSGTSHIKRHNCITGTVSSGQQRISSFFGSSKPVPAASKRKVIDSCVNMCAKDLRPFSVVDGEGFKQFAATMYALGAAGGNHHNPTDLLPHRTTVSNASSKKAAAIRTELITDLQQYLIKIGGGMTLDMWSDPCRNIPYLSITAQYIDDEWNMIDRVLATAEFDTELRKTGENILALVLKVLKHYQLDREKLKLVVFVTDKGANIRAAIRSYERLACICHILNTVLSTVFDSSKELVPLSFLQCLSDCKALVAYFKRAGLMHLLKKSLKQQIEVRWNSHLTMLFSIAEQLDDVDAILMDRNEVDRASSIDRDTLETMVSFLKPFKEVSDELEASKTPTLHLVLPGILRLKSHCEVQDSDTFDMMRLKEATAKLLAEKAVPDKLHKVAAFLSPRMKSLKMLTEDDKKTVHKEVEGLCRDIVVPVKPSTSQAGSKAKVPKLSSSILADYEDSDTEEQIGTTTELDEYIKCKVDKGIDILKFWQVNAAQYPTLSLLARRVLAVPASSAASERNFSLAGRTVEKRRSRLIPSSVDSLLFLNSNLKY